MLRSASGREIRLGPALGCRDLLLPGGLLGSQLLHLVGVADPAIAGIKPTVARKQIGFGHDDTLKEQTVDLGLRLLAPEMIERIANAAGVARCSLHPDAQHLQEMLDMPL